MPYDVSSGTFIRNNQMGAFCLWESMASLLPLVSDMHIIDLGSTDGTLEILKDLELHNKKIHVYESAFSCIDASAFADAANDCVNRWQRSVGFFWQADEVWHQDLLKMTAASIESGKRSFNFWRYQLKENFQLMKWPPHPVHRFGTKTNFLFVGDGMNTQNIWGNDVVGNHDMGWFTKWGSMDPLTIPVNEMILDISQNGGFRNNMVERRQLHAPMWHESAMIDGKTLNQWLREAQANPNWELPTTPYNLPKIMRYHVGKVHYEVRQDLLEAIRTNTTEVMVGL